MLNTLKGKAILGADEQWHVCTGGAVHGSTPTTSILLPTTCNADGLPFARDVKDVREVHGDACPTCIPPAQAEAPLDLSKLPVFGARRQQATLTPVAAPAVAAPAPAVAETLPAPPEPTKE